MQILYIITDGHWGGAQRYVYDLATHQPTATIAVAIGSSGANNDLADKLQTFYTSSPVAPRTISLHHLVRKIHIWHDCLAILELIHLYGRLQPDIVHLNSSKAGIIGSCAALFFPRIKIVYTVHGWVFNEPGSKYTKILFTWLEKITSWRKNTTITLSPSDTTTGQNSLHIPASKITCIPLGIEPPTLLPTPEARELIHTQLPAFPTQTKKWVGIIANLYRTKGLDTLLQAIALNIATYNDTVFCIIGDGPERENLLHLAHKLDLREKVYFVGTIKNAAHTLQAFNLFVLPSRKEGLPYTLLEAMLAHVPIISTRVGGIPDLLEHQKTALLCEPDNATDLSQQLVFALEHPAQMETYANQAYTVAQKYSLNQLLKQTTACYSKLLTDPK